MIDLLRASNTTIQHATDTCDAWEPLQCDLPTPGPGRHHVVTQISAQGIFAANPLALGAAVSTLSGIFLVPTTAAQESLADATAGFNLESRGIRLGCAWYVEAVGAQWAFSVVVETPAIVVVPFGWQLRFICIPNPGTATPGPGVGSRVRLSASIIDEKDAGR